MFRYVALIFSIGLISSSLHSMNVDVETVILDLIKSKLRWKILPYEMIAAARNLRLASMTYNSGENMVARTINMLKLENPDLVDDWSQSGPLTVEASMDRIRTFTNAMVHLFPIVTPRQVGEGGFRITPFPRLLETYFDNRCPHSEKKLTVFHAQKITTEILFQLLDKEISNNLPVLVMIDTKMTNTIALKHLTYRHSYMSDEFVFEQEKFIYVDLNKPTKPLFYGRSIWDSNVVDEVTSWPLETLQYVMVVGINDSLNEALVLDNNGAITVQRLQDLVWKMNVDNVFSYLEYVKNINDKINQNSKVRHVRTTSYCYSQNNLIKTKQWLPYSVLLLREFSDEQLKSRQRYNEGNNNFQKMNQAVHDEMRNVCDLPSNEIFDSRGDLPFEFLKRLNMIEQAIAFADENSSDADEDIDDSAEDISDSDASNFEDFVDDDSESYEPPRKRHCNPQQ